MAMLNAPSVISAICSERRTTVSVSGLTTTGFTPADALTRDSSLVAIQVLSNCSSRFTS
jgi:hypothetical protein